MRRTITGIAIAVGALMPFRPFFVKASDPATEPIDLILTPVYALWRVAPRMGEFGESAFFVAAILMNAILYGLLAYYICSKVASE